MHEQNHQALPPASCHTSGQCAVERTAAHSSWVGANCAFNKGEQGSLKTMRQLSIRERSQYCREAEGGERGCWATQEVFLMLWYKFASRSFWFRAPLSLLFISSTTHPPTFWVISFHCLCLFPYVSIHKVFPLQFITIMLLVINMRTAFYTRNQASRHRKDSWNLLCSTRRSE